VSDVLGRLGGGRGGRGALLLLPPLPPAIDGRVAATEEGRSPRRGGAAPAAVAHLGQRLDGELRLHPTGGQPGLRLVLELIPRRRMTRMTRVTWMTRMTGSQRRRWCPRLADDTGRLHLVQLEAVRAAVGRGPELVGAALDHGSAVCGGKVVCLQVVAGLEQVVVELVLRQDQRTVARGGEPRPQPVRLRGWGGRRCRRGWRHHGRQ